MDNIKVRITWRNTKGKPCFKDYPFKDQDRVIRELEAKGYTNVQANPPYVAR